MRPFLITLILAMPLFVCAAFAGGIDTLYYARVEPHVDDTGGYMKGPTVEVIYRIMKEAGNPLSPKALRFMPWGQALALAKTEKGKGIMTLIRTPEREKHFKWVGPIGHVSLGAWARISRHIEIASIQDLYEYRIAVVRHSALDYDFLQEWDSTPERVERVNSPKTQLNMLKEGRVDLVILNAQNVRKLFLLQGLDPDAYEQVWTFVNSDFYLALNRDTDDALVDALQAALDRLKTRRPGQSKSTFQWIYDSYQ
ncbi:ABC transporter substrate-binding protein [uncultured Pseudodesulfovibrio sp.]|uniref:substrate-binding periplasmic protein n=1 Tax=uncultured Pseudodesulfovibrio sp. TaxID=2035858 RepID=UPI0029C87216|nr:ABC transporter substrate-binding protein [uncultured Pseudodesulfovibrio sp.]